MATNQAVKQVFSLHNKPVPSACKSCLDPRPSRNRDLCLQGSLSRNATGLSSSALHALRGTQSLMVREWAAGQGFDRLGFDVPFLVFCSSVRTDADFCLRFSIWVFVLAGAETRFGVSGLRVLSVQASNAQALSLDPLPQEVAAAVSFCDKSTLGP